MPTGALINKKTSKIIAVGEWEALEQFLTEMKALNQQLFNKCDFHIKIGGVSIEMVKQANIFISLGFGNRIIFTSALNI